MVVACGGVKVLCEVILEAEAQRILEALMAAVAEALPARKVRGVGHVSMLMILKSCAPARFILSPISTSRSGFFWPVQP